MSEDVVRKPVMGWPLNSFLPDHPVPPSSLGSWGGNVVWFLQHSQQCALAFSLLLLACWASARSWSLGPSRKPPAPRVRGLVEPGWWILAWSLGLGPTLGTSPSPFLPFSTRELNGNNITRVHKNDFAGLKQLRVL